MLTRCSWVLCTSMCVACAEPENEIENVRRAEQAIWHGTLGSQANAPGLNRAKGGYCSTVLLSPRVAVTDQHCSDLLPVTDSSGKTTYSEVIHPQNKFWNGASAPRVTWTWAPSDWVAPERTRDLRIIAFENTEAPLTVFPQRVRYLDSSRESVPRYASGVSQKLPVVFMGWGNTHEEKDGKFYEQWYFTFGNELSFTVAEGNVYRSWSANLGPFQYYRGPDSGDSGGPLFRQLSRAEPWEFELLGLNGGPNNNAKNEDPRYTKAQLAAMSTSERQAAYDYEITYHWADLTHSAFLEELYYVTGDLTRPGRLYGEKDYYGPIRREFDADGDHFYGTAGSSCPMYLYDQRGTVGELNQTGGVDYSPNLGAALPALHAYRALYLNDRTRVYDQNGAWGTVVLGSHESNLLDGATIGGRIGTDTEVGKLYVEGGGTLTLVDRANVRKAWWSGVQLSVAPGVVVTNSPESNVMRLPQSRFVKAFPYRMHGVRPIVKLISGAATWNGECNPTINCHAYQSIEPNNTVTLAAGYYGDLFVKAKSTLTLSGGDYYFDGLTTETDSKLVVASGASARVWVRDNLTLRNYGNITRAKDPTTGFEKVTNVSAAANLFIGYYGLTEASVWELTGSLLAPYAKVTLETNRPWATAHAGMVIANRIEMHQGNSFYHVPYQCR